MRNLACLKPQDILILMKLISRPSLPQKELATQLLLSQAEVSHGLTRLKNSSLLTQEGFAQKESALELFVHAVKYFYPAQYGPPALGIPTSYAHPSFRFVKYNPEDSLVWPSAIGSSRGTTLIPFYPTIPDACSQDESLYKIAALVEMLRAGKAREKKLAEEELRKVLAKAHEK